MLPVSKFDFKSLFLTMNLLACFACANVVHTKAVELSAVAPALKLMAHSNSLGSGENTALSATGGMPPYSYAVISGRGAIGSVQGALSYLAQGTSDGERVIIEVRDQAQSKAQIGIEIRNLSFAVDAQTVSVGQSVQLIPSGGVPPYGFSILSNGHGSIVGSTFTAPSFATSTRIRLVDSQESSFEYVIQVQNQPHVQMSEAQIYLYRGESKQLRASGGVPSEDGIVRYTFSLTSGNGVLTSGGMYSAPNSANTDAYVNVCDGRGNCSSQSEVIHVRELIDLNSSANFQLVNSAILSFNLPLDLQNFRPNFIVGGDGSFQPAVSIPLLNYNRSDEAPYIGQIGLSTTDDRGRSRSYLYGFCIAWNTNHDIAKYAYLANIQTFQGSIEYNVTPLIFSSFAGPTSEGTSTSAISSRFPLTNDGSPAASPRPATFSIASGHHDHSRPDCSEFTSWQLSSASVR